MATRLSIDRLRKASVEREKYTGPWLPEPLFGSPSRSPEEQLELASDLSMAFMVLLERLAPVERAAFLLHDVFDCAYPEIARILGKSEAACRQIVHRARERVRSDRQRFRASEEDHRRLIEKFMEAANAGDEATLLSLFAEDATLTSDGGGVVPAARKVVRGRELHRAPLPRRRAQAPRAAHADHTHDQRRAGPRHLHRRRAVLGHLVRDRRPLHPALYNILNPEKLKGISRLEGTTD